MFVYIVTSLPCGPNDECFPDLKVDVDFPGSDVLQIISADELHCQRACSQHPSCQFFSFLRPDWTRDSRRFYCYLKHTDSGKPSRVTKLKGVTSGYSLKNCKETTECFPDLKVDVDFPGSDVLQIISTNELHCQRACSQHPSCQFFSFLRPDWTRDSRRFYCYLKHTDSGKPSRVTKLKGVTSGYSLKNSKETTECFPDLKVDVDFPGSDVLQIISTNELHCQRACSQHPSCQFFSFLRPDWTRDSRRFYCYLKHTDSGKPSRVTKLKGVTSGYSLKNECFPDLKVDVDFPGSDVLQIISTDELHCQRACSQHHSCQFFSFLRPDWTRDSRRFYCYLKHTDSGKPSRVTKLKGVTSGYSLKNVKETTECFPDLKVDVDFPGSDVLQIISTDELHCQRACSQHPSCQFFSFLRPDWTRDSRRFYCYLKHTDSGEPSRVTKLKGVTSGYSLKNCKETTGGLSLLPLHFSNIYKKILIRCFLFLFAQLPMMDHLGHSTSIQQILEKISA
ncbi:coagulation factor XI-like isoform X1 [Sardina pilchardus]|uniref:coagulation factor XI-like isoform X1 n=1 Tax=Sardina pilchardus TaxID=27697 RepID=UPI002E124729